jgi:hypothetical protein
MFETTIYGDTALTIGNLGLLPKQINEKNFINRLIDAIRNDLINKGFESNIIIIGFLVEKV